MSALYGKNSGKFLLYPWARSIDEDQRSGKKMKEVYDGQVWKTIMEEEEKMKEAFCQIGLGMFYDGFQVFNGKINSNKSAWAMFVYILNYPAEIRHKLGIGLFLILLHDISYTKKAWHLVNEVVLRELQRLHNGIVIQREKILGEGVAEELNREWTKRCCDHNINNPNQKEEVYLRAALIVATLDQKGVGEWCLQQVESCILIEHLSKLIEKQ